VLTKYRNLEKRVFEKFRSALPGAERASGGNLMQIDHTKVVETPAPAPRGTLPPPRTAKERPRVRDQCVSTNVFHEHMMMGDDDDG
jgi:hypothetical protein